MVVRLRRNFFITHIFSCLFTNIPAFFDHPARRRAKTMADD
jgi:hypothetical protein